MRRFKAVLKHKRIRVAVWVGNGLFGALNSLKWENKGGVEWEFWRFSAMCCFDVLLSLRCFLPFFWYFAVFGILA